jgi:hypothetical protein
MNGAAFDDIARSLANGRCSRKSLFGLLAAGLISSACGDGSSPAIPADATGDNPFCVSNCSGNNMKSCQHDCVGNNNAACQYNCTGDNASACQHDCAGKGSTDKCRQNCANAVPTCSAGQTACITACTSLQTDPHNCGGCGNVCPPGQPCVQGRCDSRP